MHPGIFLCTPLVYSYDNWVKKCAHIGHTCAKNVRPALEMCAPGAECTVNFFEHWYVIERYVCLIVFMVIAQTHVQAVATVH